MSTLRVGVLRGGPSHEYEVSLRTGGNVLKHLPAEKYQPIDIFIDKKGAWHLHGAERSPDKILKQIDVAFNALHGHFGEDGKIQQLLTTFNVPYTGSTPLASALGMNKVLSKEAFIAQGITTPEYVVVTGDEYLDQKLVYIFPDSLDVFMVKPISSGSSLGASVVYNPQDLLVAVRAALEYSPSVLIEKFIEGREVTCGVIESVAGDTVYALAPIQIVKPEGNNFFDYKAKSEDGPHKVTVTDFTPEEKEGIQRLAIEAHQALGLRHYSRSDFIVGDDGEIYLLEANSLPGLAPEAVFQKSLAHLGSTFPEFLDHVLTLAMRG